MIVYIDVISFPNSDVERYVVTPTHNDSGTYGHGDCFTNLPDAKRQAEFWRSLGDGIIQFRYL